MRRSEKNLSIRIPCAGTYLGPAKCTYVRENACRSGNKYVGPVFLCIKTRCIATCLAIKHNNAVYFSTLVLLWSGDDSIHFNVIHKNIVYSDIVSFYK